MLNGGTTVQRTAGPLLIQLPQDITVLLDDDNDDDDDDDDGPLIELPQDITVLQKTHGRGENLTEQIIEVRILQ